MIQPGACAASLLAIAKSSPRVHCITNTVAMAYTANLLLAVGATPSMSLAPGEIADFVSGAASLSINIGTLDAQRREAIEQALAVAREQRKRWVLDPVLVNRSSERRSYAGTLLPHAPSVIRGNRAEIAALAGADGAGAARALASATGSIVVQTGATDIVTDGRRTISIANGHPMMARITGMGCAASALIAAFLAVEEKPLAAAAQAALAVGVAGEMAARSARGPGTLQVQILDELYRLNEATLEERGRVVESSNSSGSED